MVIFLSFLCKIVRPLIKSFVYNTFLWTPNIQMAMVVLPKVKSALCATSQLPGGRPTDVEDATASFIQANLCKIQGLFKD